MDYSEYIGKEMDLHELMEQIKDKYVLVQAIRRDESGKCIILVLEISDDEQSLSISHMNLIHKNPDKRYTLIDERIGEFPKSLRLSPFYEKVKESDLGLLDYNSCIGMEVGMYIAKAIFIDTVIWGEAVRAGDDQVIIRILGFSDDIFALREKVNKMHAAESERKFVVTPGNPSMPRVRLIRND